MGKACVICGTPWEDGKGFVLPHRGLCANEAYGWNWVREVPDPNPFLSPGKVEIDEELKRGGG